MAPRKTAEELQDERIELALDRERFEIQRLVLDKAPGAENPEVTKALDEIVNGIGMRMSTCKAGN